MKKETKKIVEKFKKGVVQEQTLPGFRKGMTKEKILNSLTNEDWVFIDKCKQAEELKVNETAYKFFINSDQAVQECNRIRSQIIDAIANILLLNKSIESNKKDILTGTTTKNDESGEPISLEELEYINLKNDSKIRLALSILNANLSRLYTFVGKRGFDKEIYFKEEDYNEFIKNVVGKLDKTPYKIL